MRRCEGLCAGQEIGRCRLHFRTRTLPFDFHRAIGAHFTQEDGAPGGNLNVADIDTVEDYWKSHGSEEDDLPGPELRLLGDFGEVERGGGKDGSSRSGLGGGLG